MLLKYPNEYYTNKRDYNKKLMSDYVENMFFMYKKFHPDIDDNILKKKIQDIILKKIKLPKIKYLYFENSGSFIKKETNLLKFTDNIKDKIITPSGSIYKKSSELESIHNPKILNYQQIRKKIKSEEIKLESLNKKEEANIKNLEQNAIKVFINAVSGNMAASIYFKFIPGYNSITSTVRYNISVAYSFLERFLCGNIYLTNEEDVINYITILLQNIPNIDILRNIVKTYKLYIPNHQEVFRYFYDNIQKPN